MSHTSSPLPDPLALRPTRSNSESNEASTESLNAFRERYRAFRTGSPNGAKGEINQPVGIPDWPKSKIIRNRPFTRSQILTQCAEADVLRARFEFDRARLAAAALVEGGTIGHDDEHSEAQQRQSARILGLCAIALVCGSCCQLCVELLVKYDGRTGNIVSAAEYLYCALLSSRALFQPRVLPWQSHLALWAAGVAHSALTNAGLAVRGLPMPVALVIKNGSLLAQLLVGRLVGKRPSRRELVAAALISVGLLLGAMSRRQGGKAAADAADAADAAAEGPDGTASVYAYAVSINCLGGALLARAASGLVQERVFHEHGVAYNEVLFWRAALGAPVFLAGNLMHSRGEGGEGGEGDSVLSEVLGSGWLLGLLVANVVGDHITKLAVTRLIAEAGSLTATLVIQLQRFASCVCSATLLADEAPPPALWLAIGFVAAGSLASIKREGARKEKKS